MRSAYIGSGSKPFSAAVFISSTAPSGSRTSGPNGIYGQWFDKSRDQYLEDKKNGVQAVDKSAEYLDAMSAIICVIDYEKFKRGIGV